MMSKSGSPVKLVRAARAPASRSNRSTGCSRRDLEAQPAFAAGGGLQQARVEQRHDLLLAEDRAHDRCELVAPKRRPSGARLAAHLGGQVNRRAADIACSQRRIRLAAARVSARTNSRCALVPCAVGPRRAVASSADVGGARGLPAIRRGVVTPHGSPGPSACIAGRNILRGTRGGEPGRRRVASRVADP